MPSVCLPAAHPVPRFFCCICLCVMRLGNYSRVNSAGGQAMALCRGCWLLMCQVRLRCHLPEYFLKEPHCHLSISQASVRS